MSYELNASFDEEVIQASHHVPVVVDFWAPWCGPCQALGPVLEKLADEATGKWKLVKINTEEQPAIAQEYQIASIPAVKLFVDGKPTEEFNGALPERQLRDWLEKSLPSASAEELKRAQQLLDQREDSAARDILDAILENDPTEEAAILLKAELEIGSDPRESQTLLAMIKAGSDHFDRARALGNIADYQLATASASEAPDSKGKASYLSGLKALSERDYALALERLIESIEADRGFLDASALGLGKAIFQWLGIRHPVADQFYRRFTSVLYI